MPASSVLIIVQRVLQAQKPPLFCHPNQRIGESNWAVFVDLLEPGEFGSRSLKDRNVGVCILP